MRLVPNYELIEFLNWMAQRGEQPADRDFISFLQRMDEQYQAAMGGAGYSYTGLADSAQALLQGSAYQDLMVSDTTGAALVEAIRRIGLPVEQLEQATAEAQRYRSVPYHAVFLFLERGDFPAFLRNNRGDLHHLTGALLDIYYTPEDLARRVSGYEIIRDFSSVEQAKLIAKLPALLLWKDSLEGASVVSLDRLDHDDIFRVMQTIVQRIAEGKGLAEISEAAYNKVKELADIQLAAQAVVYGGIHYYGGVTGNVNSGSGPQNNVVGK